MKVVYIIAESEDGEVEHNWGELDKDAETTDEATERLAVLHMDWDRIRAVDLMVLFNSFLPPEGMIKSVTVSCYLFTRNQFLLIPENSAFHKQNDKNTRARTKSEN